MSGSFTLHLLLLFLFLWICYCCCCDLDIILCVIHCDTYIRIPYLTQRLKQFVVGVIKTTMRTVAMDYYASENVCSSFFLSSFFFWFFVLYCEITNTS